jgi:hypothetical protein
MRVFRWIGIAIAAVVGLLACLALAARFSDGPIAILPGGALESGELVSETGIDWGFATDIREIEFQLLDPPRSRVVWIIVHEGELYIPCGFIDVPGWKQWPHEAEKDGRSVLRIDGKRYERNAERVTDPALVAELMRLAAEKYGYGDPDSAGDGGVWFFRMEPRRRA